MQVICKPRIKFILFALLIVVLPACASPAATEPPAMEAPAAAEPAAPAAMEAPAAPVSYPALSGTDLAYPSQALTSETIQNVKLLGAWGQPSPEAVAWAPDGSWLATGGSTGVTLYNPINLTQLNWQPAPGPVAGLASASLVGSNALLAATGWDGWVTMWNAFPGGQLANPQRWQAHDSGIMAATFSPNTQFLATGDLNGQIRLWSPTSNPTQAWATLAGHQGWINSLAFSPDGSQLASAGGDGRVKLWKTDGSPDASRVIDIGGGEVDSLAFSPDGGLLASGGENGRIDLWNTTNGNLQTSLNGPGAGIRSLAFTPSSTSDNAILAAGYNDGSLWVWSIPSYSTVSRFEATGLAVNGLAFSPDGQYLAAAADTLRLWQAIDLWNGGAAQGILPRAEGPLTSLAFSPDGAELVTGGWDGNLRVWQTTDGSQLKILGGQPDPITSLASSPAITPSGMVMASGTNSGIVQLWRLPDGSPVDYPFSHAQRVSGLAFSPDGNLLASIDGSGFVQVNDISTIATGATALSLNAQIFQNIGAAPSPGVGVAFSPDGSLLISAGQDGNLRLWQQSQINAASQPEDLGTGSALTAIAISPDGEWLATAFQNGAIALWPAQALTSDAQPRYLDGTYPQLNSLAFSPDGSMLAGGIGEGIQLWDVAQGRQVALLKGYTHPVTGVAFSPDGRYLASTSQDGVIRIWGAMP